MFAQLTIPETGTFGILFLISLGALIAAALAADRAKKALQAIEDLRKEIMASRGE